MADASRSQVEKLADMSPESRAEAWIALPSEEALRADSPGPPHPYEVHLGGTIALMARLIAAHPLIGPSFRQLTRTVLFGPGALSRPEREMVAAVAASAQDCLY